VYVSVLLLRFHNRFRNSGYRSPVVILDQQIDLAYGRSSVLVSERSLIVTRAASDRALDSDSDDGNQGSKGTKGQIDKGSSGVL